MAVAGLLLGIVSVICTTVFMMFFSHYGDYGFFSGLACVGVGLPLSWTAVRRAHQGAASSSDIPAAGLAINVVALVIVLIWSVLIAIELNSLRGWF